MSKLKDHIEKVAMETEDPKSLAVLAQALNNVEKAEAEAKKAEVEEAKLDVDKQRLDVEKQKAEADKKKLDIEAKKAEVEEIRVQEMIDLNNKTLEAEIAKAEAAADAELKRLDIETAKVEESKKSRIWSFIGGVIGTLAAFGGVIAAQELKNKGDAEHRADVERIEKSENIALNLKRYKRN